LKAIPIKRYADVEEIAPAVLFLATLKYSFKRDLFYFELNLLNF